MHVWATNIPKGMTDMLSALRLLSLSLLFVLTAGSISIAPSQQDGNEVGRLKDASTRQDLIREHVVAATAKWDKRFLGRKILLFAITKTSKYSNAAVGCEVEGKGHYLNLEDQKSGKTLLSEKATDGPGFVAANDYLDPSHHPPVNN